MDFQSRMFRFFQTLGNISAINLFGPHILPNSFPLTVLFTFENSKTALCCVVALDMRGPLTKRSCVYTLYRIGFVRKRHICRREITLSERGRTRTARALRSVVYTQTPLLFDTDLQNISGHITVNSNTFRLILFVGIY